MRGVGDGHEDTGERVGDCHRLRDNTDKTLERIVSPCMPINDCSKDLRDRKSPLGT